MDMLLSRAAVGRIGVMGLIASLAATVPARAQGTEGFIPVGLGPFFVAVNPVTNRIYASNQEDGTVSVISGGNKAVIATIPVGPVAEGVAVNVVTNRIYTASFAAKTVAVIDGATNQVIATVPIGIEPFNVAVNPATNRIYARSVFHVAVVDGMTNTLLTTIPIDGGPDGLAVNASASRIYVSDTNNGAIAVVNGATHAIIQRIPVDTSTLGTEVRGLTVDPATNRLYLATGATGIRVIDANGGDTLASIPIDGHAVNAAFNPSTNRVYVRAMQGTRRGGVAVIDATSNTVVDVFAVADTATDVDVAVNPATNHVYVPLAGLGAIWVTQDPSAIGGRDFGISLRPEGVRLSWSPGTRETSYSIARWGADTGTMEMIPASGVLPSGTRSFTDSDTLTESGYLYALLPRDGSGILWMSDLVGLWTDVPPTPAAGSAPADFTLRHGRHAYMLGQAGYAMVMTWRAPGPETAGYVIVGSDSAGTTETVVAAAETRAIDLVGWPKCYTVFADAGALVGYTPTLCGVPVSGLEP